MTSVADWAFAKAVWAKRPSSMSSTRIASIHHPALFHQAYTSWLTTPDRNPKSFRRPSSDSGSDIHDLNSR